MAKTARVVNRMTAAAKEVDFQDETNKHAHGAVQWMREHLDDDEQRERISSEDALEVSVREGWHAPRAEQEKPVEYYILLGTGGPASRIVGELDEYGQPTSATYEFQDWFKPWTAADDLSDEEEATLLEYAREFWFGE